MPNLRVFCFGVDFGGVKFGDDRAAATLKRKGKASMLDADFWLGQAMMFRQQADTVRDPEERDELRTLAQICDAVATKIEEHASGG
jgi:hypothetical protein